MSKEVDDGPRILIAEGPWGITEGFQNWWYDQVTHKCKWKNNWWLKTYEISANMMKQEAPFCTQCKEMVPGMIQTLWTLKNMDKIQNDASYGKWTAPSMSHFYVGHFYLVGTKAKP